MSLAGLDARSTEFARKARGIENVNSIALQMAAFYQDRFRAQLVELASGPVHTLEILHLQASQRGGLVQIGRDESSAGQHFVADRL